MKYILSCCLFIIFSTLHSQDTIFLSKDYKEVPRDSAAYFQIDYRNSEEPLLKRQIHWINGQIKSERYFEEEKNGKLIPEGISKYWYDSGQIFYYENYKKGKRHGELIGYWQDGSKRRRDLYKRGELKSGKVWDEDGNEIAHFPIMERATFPGGQEALAAFLKHNIPVPASQPKNTLVKVVVAFVIDKEGNVSKIDIIEGATHWYNSVTVNVLSRMPKWNPGKQFGQPVNVRYTLPVTFRK